MQMYTVIVSWLVPQVLDYKTRTRTFKVEASSCTEASEKALKLVGDVLCPAVNACYYHWPHDEVTA